MSEMEYLKPIIVVGLGNPLMADEGIGVLLVEKLAELSEKGILPSGNVEYHDGGCGGMNLLHAIAGRQKAILIDCAKMGIAPGEIRRFTPEDVQTIKKLTHMSLHQVDILKVIDMARMLDQCPDTIVIFGIEPESITRQMHLTETLKARLDLYLAEIQKEILA